MSAITRWRLHRAMVIALLLLMMIEVIWGESQSGCEAQYGN